MLATVEGVVYDTTKAKYLGGYDLRPRQNPRYEVTEELYQTPTGAYFVGRFGGDLTEYAAGELRPLSPAEAEAWASEHLPADRAAECFPRAQTFSCQENVVQICISLRQEDAAALLALLRSALPGMRDAARGSAARQVIRERV